VVRHLEDYVALLVRGVRQWGGTVFRARDAGQAREYILEVARRQGVRAVVNSKSMTTEEIGLRPHLEQAGLQVTETDLGEFLVQLAGDRPAHITAPAMHLDRHRIAALFKQHLGVDCPPDPLILTRQASQHLRPRYLEADLGITGVNFAAAKEATLVMLENEGNLLQCATLPRVHLAVMGLEKIVPALADLEACLQLLPASATGQRLTALVHFLKGLKPGTAEPQAFYLVLLDNGRSRLAADPELWEGLSCLRCGACLNICPVFQAGGAHLYGRTYPGAIGILLAPFLAPTGDIADFCTQCGVCGEICPAGIRLPELILAARRASPRFRRWRLWSRAGGLVLSHPQLYRGLVRQARQREGLRSIMDRRLPGFSLARESFHGRGFSVRAGAGWPTEAAKAGPRPGEQPGTGFGPQPVVRAASPIDTLEERLKEAGSVLHRVATPAAGAHLVAQVGGQPLVVGEGPGMASWWTELAAQGLNPRRPADLAGAEADTVVLPALGAVAEMGAVLASHTSGDLARLACRARRVVFLLDRQQAGLSLAQALEITRRESAPLVSWHTGPSRTADIEKELVLGAQGTGQVEIVVWG